MKTYNESRIELRNLQISKKTLDKSSQFLSSEQPSEPKSLDVDLNIGGSENVWLPSTWRLFDSSFERKGALVMVEICVLCSQWFSNQFEIVSETPFSFDTVGSDTVGPETDWNIRIGKLLISTDIHSYSGSKNYLISRAN